MFKNFLIGLFMVMAVTVGWFIGLCEKMKLSTKG